METKNGKHASGPAIFDATRFANGNFNDWEFKSWMPDGRPVQMQECTDGVGYLGGWGLEIEADGGGDDGIFFLQKIYRVRVPVVSVSVTWWFARLDPAQPVNNWPRVAYTGPPKDLANSPSQHDFTWFSDTSQSTLLDGPGLWNIQYHTELVRLDSDQLQVCIGWKINWETRRTSYVDRVTVVAV